MSESLLLDKMRSAAVSHNPYYEYFMDSIGKGQSIGDIIRTEPTFQRGYGVIHSAYNYKDRDHLGMGIGSFLMKLFRFTKPLIKKGLHQVVDVASKVATDTIEGRNIKDSFKQRSREKANEIIEKIPSAFSGVINKTTGSGKMINSTSLASIRQRRRRKRSRSYDSDSVGEKNITRKKQRNGKVSNNKYPLLRLLR